MDQERKPKPALSVVLITPSSYQVIRETVRHLLNQEERGELELIILAPSASELEPDLSALSHFHSYRILELGRISTTGSAMAKGYLKAASNIAAYCEEHSYPGKGWAGQIIKAHRGPWAAVGWCLTNQNAGCLTSWSSLFTDFGPWVAPAAAGVVNSLAGHHISYKTAVLHEFGNDLENLLEHETAFTSVLKEHGYRLYLESGAVSSHVNISNMRSYIYSEFHGARIFAANKAFYDGWGPIRRLIYFVGSPLRPLVQGYRITKHIQRTGNPENLIPRIYPFLVLPLISHALGEMVGYLLGKGAAAKKRASIELNRDDHLN